jgi:hypothetical protein
MNDKLADETNDAAILKAAADLLGDRISKYIDSRQQSCCHCHCHCHNYQVPWSWWWSGRNDVLPCVTSVTTSNLNTVTCT